MGRAAAVRALAFGLCLVSGAGARAEPFDPRPPDRDARARSSRAAEPPGSVPASVADPRPITPRSATGAASPRAAGSVWSTLFALAAVIGLILLAARFWRKHAAPSSGGLPGEAFEILGRRRLDPRRSIELFRVGRRILVVGSSGDGLRTLAQIDDPVEVDHLAGLCRRPDPDPAFAQRMRAILRGAQVPEDHAGQTAADERSAGASPSSTPRNRERVEAAHG
ncbi:MAG: flagellar biosynthetic protein FliO [Planctomycetales bacterium]